MCLKIELKKTWSAKFFCHISQYKVGRTNPKSVYSGEEQTRENKKKERIKTKRQKEKKCIKTKRDQKTEKLLHKDNKRRNTSIIMKGIQMGNKTEKQRGRQIEMIKIKWMKKDR